MDEKINFILNYKFKEDLLKKVKEKLQCNDNHMMILSDALKDYLIARLIYLDTWKPVTMPSTSADELWHEFILNTRDYFDFCDNVYGKYLHHEPYGKFDISESEDEGLKNLFIALSESKGNREYTSNDMNQLNKNIENFHLLFCVDSIVKNNPYEEVIKENN